MSEKPPYDTEWTDEPVCPYCAGTYGDAWELDLWDDDEREVFCHECSKPYSLRAHVSVTYTTQPSKEGKT